MDLSQSYAELKSHIFKPESDNLLLTYATAFYSLLHLCVEVG